MKKIILIMLMVLVAFSVVSVVGVIEGPARVVNVHIIDSGDFLEVVKHNKIDFRYNRLSLVWEFRPISIWRPVSEMRAKSDLRQIISELKQVADQLVGKDELQGYRLLDGLHASFQGNVIISGLPDLDNLASTDSSSTTNPRRPVLVVRPGNSDGTINPGIVPSENSGTTKQGSPCTSQNCKEVDNIWLQIVNFVDPGHRNQVWNPVIGWGNSGSSTPTSQPSPSSPLTQSPPTGPSEIRQKIVEIATAEEQRWAGKNENDPEMVNILQSYFNSGFCGSWAKSQGDVTDWSAAFVSYVVREATQNFAGSCSHVRYFHTHRISPSTCKSYPLSQISNIQPGDILCKCRGRSCPLTFNVEPESSDQDTVMSEIAHCDIVVNKAGTRLDLIGGNLGDGVGKRPVSLNNVNNPPYFGFISCN